MRDLGRNQTLVRNLHHWKIWISFKISDAFGCMLGATNAKSSESNLARISCITTNSIKVEAPMPKWAEIEEC